ncbi:putative MoaC family [Trypanosoma vivax]|uniref:Putative molybdenum cofactor biosynthesis protein n=1 Tax=Trypanosoma vivax (strain Y486) TaxID=1055687 RepID=G0UD99_TRYVY|nr:putative molybdenum cofactor biosynthesis protein [Trypanosoma vivax]KAH8608817.1 putative MoaC family [Trypanosoma vivax]CCC53810.1 putative molybdenum cofactor biosynthesis protein [Trypanosoma vivax Y486]
MLRLALALLSKRKPPPRAQRERVAILPRHAQGHPPRKHPVSQSRVPPPKRMDRATHVRAVEEDDSELGSRRSGVGAAVVRAAGAAQSSREAQSPSAVTVPAVASSDVAAGAAAEPKKPQYCLATAVSTIIVPPTANSLLEVMKQTLTPAVRRQIDCGAGGGGPEPSNGTATQMEEFYTPKKGPLFATAVVAGTNAVKQASQLIPFCHPVRIQKCSFTFRRRVLANFTRGTSLPHRVVLRKRSTPSPAPSRTRSESSIIYCFCTVATEEEARAGVEMEALAGANVAALTLYDMLRSLPGAQEDGLGVGESFVLAKRGGRGDFTKLLVSETPRDDTTTLLTQGAEASHSNGKNESESSSGVLAGSAGADSATAAPRASGRNGDVGGEKGCGYDGDYDPPSAGGAEAPQATSSRRYREGAVKGEEYEGRGGGKDEEARVDEETERAVDSEPGRERGHRRDPHLKQRKEEDDMERASGDDKEKDPWWSSPAHEKKVQQMRARGRGDDAQAKSTAHPPARRPGQGKAHADKGMGSRKIVFKGEKPAIQKVKSAAPDGRSGNKSKYGSVSPAKRRASHDDDDDDGGYPEVEEEEEEEIEEVMDEEDVGEDVHPDDADDLDGEHEEVEEDENDGYKEHDYDEDEDEDEGDEEEATIPFKKKMVKQKDRGVSSKQAPSKSVGSGGRRRSDYDDGDEWTAARREGPDDGDDDLPATATSRRQGLKRDKTGSAKLARRRGGDVSADEDEDEDEVAMPVEHDLWESETEIEGAYEEDDDADVPYYPEKKRRLAKPHIKKAKKPSATSKSSQSKKRARR